MKILKKWLKQGVLFCLVFILIVGCNNNSKSNHEKSKIIIKEEKTVKVEDPSILEGKNITLNYVWPVICKTVWEFQE